MTNLVEPRASWRDAVGAQGEPAWDELWQELRSLMHCADPTDRVIGVQQLKAKVYRLQFDARAPWSSLVVKRLEPAVAQRTRLLAQRWLPALGLDGVCPRLLGGAADRRGEVVWLVQEDLGDETLAARATRERVDAAVRLVAELHARAARHAVLPDVRRVCGSLGMAYFTANVGDAIAALEALQAAGAPAPPSHAGLTERLLARLRTLLADAPRRARVFERAAGPDTLLHGDLWTINIFVRATAERPQVCLVDWDRMGVGPFSYDLSTLLLRFPAEQRPGMLETYRDAAARAGWQLGPLADLELLFDTAERARYANRVIWPAVALLQERAAWGFPELAEVERWFEALDSRRVL
jgi:aminoglycoside phosphotransferase (APT) family kinase protein